jgi:hypothetical protein
MACLLVAGAWLLPEAGVYNSPFLSVFFQKHFLSVLLFLTPLTNYQGHVL